MIEVCDAAIASGLSSEKKVKFAHEKFRMVQLLGLSVKLLKDAEQQTKHFASNKVPKDEQTDEGEFECDICAKMYKSVRNLNNHKAAMHSGAVECDRCSAVFCDKAVFNEHLKDCPWRCDKCDYTTKRSGNLVTHQNKKHKTVVTGIQQL